MNKDQLKGIIPKRKDLQQVSLNYDDLKQVDLSYDDLKQVNVIESALSYGDALSPEASLKEIDKILKRSKR